MEQPFNISLMTDQQLGGLLLWVLGDMMSILAAGVVMVMWYEREEGEGRKGTGGGAKFRQRRVARGRATT